MWIIIVSPLFFIFLLIWQNPAFGGKMKGERQRRIEKSLNWNNGRFQNPVHTVVQTDDMPFVKLMKEFFFAKGDRMPDERIPVLPINIDSYSKKPESARITWLGHSCLLIEIDGITILTDPVFSERVSPFSFMGTKTFPFSHRFQFDELPHVDLILISHDHYDHLDYQTMLKLKDTNVTFITALGVGSHLEHWGISPDRIVELDWWKYFGVNDNLKITATPARHFSGRGLYNRFSTLWASWVIQGENENLFFGADSGYFSGFKQIGDKFGAFDLVMLECGQYSRYWPFIHMAPEETYQAAIDLQAKAVFPIHWAKYKLSIHPWKEPIERILNAGKNGEIKITTPRIGELFFLNKSLPSIRWWDEL